MPHFRADVVSSPPYPGDPARTTASAWHSSGKAGAHVRSASDNDTTGASQHLRRLVREAAIGGPPTRRAFATRAPGRSTPIGLHLKLNLLLSLSNTSRSPVTSRISSTGRVPSKVDSGMPLTRGLRLSTVVHTVGKFSPFRTNSVHSTARSRERSPDMQ
jgi:hypothetical protein